jgi:hypothetical protein
MIAPVTVCLVGCGKAKADKTAKAKDLYTGSLFRAARGFAEQCDDWYIISAKFGLLSPEKKIAPYESRLPRGYIANDNWGIAVVCALCEAMRDIHFEVVLLAGAEYAVPVAAHLSRLSICVRQPLSGMQLGQRLHWLKTEREAF